jgi:hypothetical protein
MDYKIRRSLRRRLAHDGEAEPTPLSIDYRCGFALPKEIKLA